MNSYCVICLEMKHDDAFDYRFERPFCLKCVADLSHLEPISNPNDTLGENEMMRMNPYE